MPSSPNKAQVVELQESLLDSFRRELGGGSAPKIEDWISRVPESSQAQFFASLLSVELEFEFEFDTELPHSRVIYQDRFPDFASVVDDVFDRVVRISSEAAATLELPDTQRLAPVAATTDLDPSEERIESGLRKGKMLGRYQILGLLGRGSFGEVYRVRDTELNRDVALKYARSNSDDTKADLFLDEAKLVASLEHPNIVPVYDLGFSDNGNCYVVSKLIEGEDLGDRIQRKRLGLKQSLEIAIPILEALDYAHRKGLVHRDVKPSNVLLSGTGQAFLADFGIALARENLGCGAEFVGSPAYMSPEQITGSSHRLDGRADLFSMGIVLYEMLVGVRPFRGETKQELRSQISEMEHKPLRQWNESIPEELETAIAKALSKDVSKRFSTARDFAASLGSVTDFPKDISFQETTSQQTYLKLPLSWILLVTCVVAVAFAAGFAIMNSFPVYEVSRSTNQVQADVLDRFDVLISRDDMEFQPIDQLSDIRDGDKVRFSVAFNSAVHTRLLWIDAGGRATEVFPHDTEVGIRNSGPVVGFESPVQLDRGWPVEGALGTEAAVLLVSKSPIANFSPDEIGIRLGASEGASSFHRYQANQLALVKRREAGETRALGIESSTIDNEALRLLERLRRKADVVELLVFPHR